MLVPDDQIWIVVLGFIISFILAFGIGANDVANSFGTSVGSKVLTLRNACILASIFEVLGSILLGANVSDTIRKGVLIPEIFEASNSTDLAKTVMLGHLSSLTGACIWLLVATLFKLPVSGSHSIVGAIVGYALLLQGVKGINWPKLGLIFSSWFISPILSGLVSLSIFILFDKFILKKDDPVEPGLRVLPFIYAITIFINSFSIFLSGPTLLQFDKIPLYGNFIASIGLSIISLLIVRFAIVPHIRKKIMEKNKTLRDNNEHIMTIKEKLNEINVEKKIVLDLKNGDNDKNNEKELNKKVTIVQDKPEQNVIFSWVQVLTAIFGSFAHGGNDVSNAIGPLIGLWVLAVTQDIKNTTEVPIWILLYGGVGISVGLWVWGKRVMKTIGDELTTITPSSGVTIELGSAITVLVASNIGIPISTTHCKVGSIVSVGRYRSNENVDWKIFRNIVLAWVVTFPASAGISALMMYLIKLFI